MICGSIFLAVGQPRCAELGQTSIYDGAVSGYAAGKRWLPVTRASRYPPSDLHSTLVAAYPFGIADFLKAAVALGSNKRNRTVDWNMRGHVRPHLHVLLDADRVEVLRWPGLSEQRFASDKWIVCRLVPSIAVAGRCVGRA